jgi:hypothetical protein
MALHVPSNRRRFVICETSYRHNASPDGFECVHYRVRSISPLEYAVIFSTISLVRYGTDFNTILYFNNSFETSSQSSKNTCSEEFTRTCQVAHFIVWDGVHGSHIVNHEPIVYVPYYPHVDPHGNPVLNADIIMFEKSFTRCNLLETFYLSNTRNVVRDDLVFVEECTTGTVIDSNQASR